MGEQEGESGKSHPPADAPLRGEPYSPRKEGGGGDEKPPPKPPSRAPEIITAIFTAVIAVSTMKYCAVSTRQWEVARQTMEAEQRPWISVMRVASRRIEADRPTEPTVEYTNSGHSPAQYVLTSCNFTYAPGWPDEWDLKYQPNPSLSLVGPGVTSSCTLQVPPIDTGLVDLLRKGRLNLYVYGLIQYQDGFNPNRGTSFCLQYREIGERPMYSFCQANNFAW